MVPKEPRVLYSIVDEFVKSLSLDQMRRIVGDLSPDQERLFSMLLTDAELTALQKAR